MAMASDHPPVLFSVRPPRSGPSNRPSGTTDAKSFACQLVHTLTATLDHPHALHQLTEVLSLQLGADACVLLWYHPITGAITYVCWHGQTIPQLRQLSMDSRSSQAAFQHRVALALIQHFTDPQAPQADLHWRDGLNEILREDALPPAWLQGIHSHQSIAITMAPQCQGLVLLLSRHSPFPCSIDEALEVNLSSVVAIALHQHHLQHQAQHSAEQLQYLNYLKEDFLSTLNHELRTPLTSMMLAIRMLRRPDLTPERAAMYLDILEQQCSRETNLVNDLLMLQTVDGRANQTHLAPVNLVQLLSTLAAEAQRSLAKAQLALVLNLPLEPVLIATSTSHLTRVVQELLTNARKYSMPGSTITLTLALPTADSSVATVQLSNVGDGISADELPHIFEKFHRGQNATKNAIPGTGTGLALVRGLIEQVGGNIAVSSQPLGEQLWQTCFTLEFKLHRQPDLDLERQDL
jgi:signal transduction histidine kinase